MHRNRIAEILLVALALPTTVLAAEDDRSGFYLGGGIGPALTTYAGEAEDISAFAPDAEGKNRMSLAGDLRVGYGLTNRLRVHAFHRSGWYRARVGADDATIVNGITGIGLSRYTYGLPPTAFLARDGPHGQWQRI